jgi:hypothetical protein
MVEIFSTGGSSHGKYTKVPVGARLPLHIAHYTGYDAPPVLRGHQRFRATIPFFSTCKKLQVGKFELPTVHWEAERDL